LWCETGQLNHVSGGADFEPLQPNLHVTAAAVPGGLIGQVYSQAFGLTGGGIGHDRMFRCYRSAISAKRRHPPGLKRISSRALSGTPTVPGSYTFTVLGTHANGLQATRQYARKVIPEE